MKNTIKYILSFFAFAPLFFACEKQTTPEPVRVQYPDKQSPVLRDNAYFERLRAYKKTDHSLAFGWFGSWTAIGASEQTRLSSTPDSMDIISMWSQWHSLTPEQIADKEYTQKIKGTKVVFCISAKDMPEHFKEDGVITDASIVAYAKAYGKDSMDKYQYDGIDIDFETAVDHQGPLNTTPGLFKKFCQELSKYIGPNSGTGRLFCIDGNIDYLDDGIAELCDYAVSQAYSCTSAWNLDSRTTSAVGAGWRPEQIIFTENFESLWKSGGVTHTTADGQQMVSLLGMAYYAKTSTSCGFGAYHMEYEYGHADMPYKYMRQAIQLANPAPVGDYSKNLLTINEAGEYAFEIAVFPSGAAEAFRFDLTAELANLAAAETNVPLMVDNSLVASYNDYYYTEYKTIDPKLVCFSGPLHFAAGGQSTEEPASILITDASKLGDEEYLIPVRADFSQVPGVGSNTLKEVCYLKVKRKDMVNTLTVAGASTVGRIRITTLVDGSLFSEGSFTLTADTSAGMPADTEFALVCDPDLVAAYNTANGTSYTALAKDLVSVPGKVTVRQASRTTEPVEIKAADYTKLPMGESMIALRIDLGNDPDFDADASKLVKYIVFEKIATNVDEGATSVDGTVISDKTGWIYTVNGSDYSSAMFNGNTAEWGWYEYASQSAEVEVDMGQVRTIAGWRMSVMGGYSTYVIDILRDVEVSADGQTWVKQSGGDVAIGEWDGTWQYLSLCKPVECRYIRMTYVNTRDYFYGCSEFEVYAPNN